MLARSETKSISSAIAASLTIAAALGFAACTGLANAHPAARKAATPEGPAIVTPIAVFGEDSRADLTPFQSKLANKIGTLSVGGANYCTAFCLAGDVIATAGHCLFGTAETVGPDLERVAFHLGADNPRQAVRLAGTSRRAIRNGIKAGTRSLRVAPPIDAANDWAVVRLAKPACTAGGLGLSTLERTELEARAETGDVYQIAMHRDLTLDALKSGAPCALPRAFPEASADTIAQDFLDSDAILMHTCDTGAGSSGSPLLVDGPKGPEVVGINVGTYVLSRTATSSRADANEQPKSRPIANTAIATERFRRAVEEMLDVTRAARVPHLR